MLGDFYKKKPSNKIWWVDNYWQRGFLLFSFDKKKIYNLFRDYPWKLSKEEREIFNKENPFWAEALGNR